MMLHVTSAKYLHDYQIEVSFNDGRKGITDLSKTLHGTMFAPLQDRAMFRNFRVDPELETIAWPNGADLAPEYLYFLAFQHDQQLQQTFREWGYSASLQLQEIY